MRRTGIVLRAMGSCDERRRSVNASTGSVSNIRMRLGRRVCTPEGMTMTSQAEPDPKPALAECSD